MKRLIRKPEVRKITGLSDSTIRRKELEGEFPKRIRLGPNSVGYDYDSVIEWVNNRPTVTPTRGQDNAA
jgi:prophage regulatory protein